LRERLPSAANRKYQRNMRRRSPATSRNHPMIVVSDAPRAAGIASDAKRLMANASVTMKNARYERRASR
jgi:hypothetical protein